MYVIYHRIDLDGWCSAAIMKKHCELTNQKITLMPYNYGDPLALFPEIGETVVIVDISLDIKAMIALADKHRVIWIDHHKSAIRAYEDAKAEFDACPDLDRKWTHNLETVFPAIIAGPGDSGYEATNEGREKVAACELTWRRFMDTDAVPDAVRLLSTYDAWHNADLHLWESHVMPLQYALRDIVTGPDSFPMVLLAKRKASICTSDWPAMNLATELVEKGRQFYGYQKNLDRQAIDQYCFRGRFEGQDMLFLNTPFRGSPQFRSVMQPADIMCVYCWDAKAHMFNVSFYTENPEIDCSHIAKLFGGGGHRGAAGCRLTWTEMGRLLKAPMPQQVAS